MFSPSLYLDDSCRFLTEHFNTYTDFDDVDKVLNNIKTQQLSIPKEKRPRLMIVVDDAVGLIERNSSLNYLATRFRHCNANIIMSIQSFRAASPVVRVNANYLIFMNGVVNTKELEKIEEEYGDIYKGTLIYCYKKYAKSKYDFIACDMRSNPPKMYHGFHTEINFKKHVRDAKMKNFDDSSDEEEEMSDE